MIGLTAGESANPARDVPRAVKFVFWRVLVIFLGGIFFLSLCVPYNDPTLLSGTSKTARSPFVIAFVRRNLPRGGDAINAIIVLELISPQSHRKGEYRAHKNIHFRSLPSCRLSTARSTCLPAVSPPCLPKDERPPSSER